MDSVDRNFISSPSTSSTEAQYSVRLFYGGRRGVRSGFGGDKRGSRARDTQHLDMGQRDRLIAEGDRGARRTKSPSTRARERRRPIRVQDDRGADTENPVISKIMNWRKYMGRTRTKLIMTPMGVECPSTAMEGTFS